MKPFFFIDNSINRLSENSDHFDIRDPNNREIDHLIARENRALEKIDNIIGMRWCFEIENRTNEKTNLIEMMVEKYVLVRVRIRNINNDS